MINLLIVKYNQHGIFSNDEIDWRFALNLRTQKILIELEGQLKPTKSNVIKTST